MNWNKCSLSICKCLVNRYTHVLRSYAISATSNHQEKAGLLEIEDLARQLTPNLEEEAEIFAERLACVMEESNHQGGSYL